MKIKDFSNYASGNILCEMMDDDFPTDQKDINGDRHAVRGVVLDDQDRVALLHSQSYGYYNLPGGGIEAGEDKIMTVKREMEEETGLEVEVGDKIGEVVAYLTKNQAKNISYGYFCRVIGEDKPAFEDNELEMDFVTVWADDIDKAIKLIDGTKHVEKPYPSVRDMTILRKAKEMLTKNEGEL